MRNFIQPGDTITLKALTDIKSGDGVVVGSIFGIACNDALKDTEVEVKLTGVFQLNKVATESWNVGSLIYWNEQKKLTTLEQNNNLLIGVAIEDALNPSSVGTVRLNGISFTTTPAQPPTHQDTKDK